MGFNSSPNLIHCIFFLHGFCWGVDPRSWTGKSWPGLVRTRIQLLKRSYSGYIYSDTGECLLLSDIYGHGYGSTLDNIFWETVLGVLVKYHETARQLSHQHTTGKRLAFNWCYCRFAKRPSVTFSNHSRVS
ncbi:hypothetical protein BDW75DRAFT_219401 [Aspergillus navahoensis]